ncbi:hypothetical protein F3J16_03235 [Burkholderia sp. Ap-962]|uniref:hypothetical protein n=1 Tax=Burkholderia sp. Ap-962 TaxID=2608333 RepID=UPI00141E6429|nr:hypothetical protein [Burkholderia sp. Ap-962]NIF69209.1 hypothetical protein [Burkholderia sp. Ap-962]
MKKAAALIALACLALTACGGDDDVSSASAGSSGSAGSSSGGGGSTSGTSGGTSGTSGTGSTLTPRFEAIATAADGASFLTLVNGEGAKGFHYLADLSFAGDSTIRSIFVNDGAGAVYTYELQSAQSGQAAFLTQVNAEGARGFRYEGELGFGNLYRSDGTSATYSYQLAPAVGSPADFVTQANGQGQSGYWQVSPLFLDSTEVTLYMKNNASNATYTYEAVAPSASAADFVTQANSEGARGFRAKGTQVFGSASATVYVKDQTQSPTFTYQSAAVQTTNSGFVTQSNTLGTQGNAYFGDLAFGTAVSSFYFKPANCTGFLCTTLNPLIQN